MKKFTILAAALVGSTAFASAAYAADPLPMVDAPPPLPIAPTSLAAYIQAHGIYTRGRADLSHVIADDPEYIPDLAFEEIDGLGIGGAGRGAYMVSPSFTIQLDAWVNIVSQHYQRFEIFGDDAEPAGEGDRTNATGGIASHFLFGDNGFRGGVMTSIGGVGGDGLAATLAAEAGFGAEQFRVWGQGGYVFGLRSDLADDRGYYGIAAASFYANPNLSLAAFFGGGAVNDGPDDDDVVTTREIAFGGRVETVLGDSPFSVFAAYQGVRGTEHGENDTFDVEDVTYRSHTFLAGIRMLIGAETLRDLDDRVGFADLNILYGDLTAAH